jgi:outer membrane protein OmpA-like peptidoglycan-associated protein
MQLVVAIVVALLVVVGAYLARDELADLLSDRDTASQIAAKPAPDPKSPPPAKVAALPQPGTPSGLSPAPPQPTVIRIEPATKQQPAADKPPVTFDVVRIDPGASVFAGQAPPNSEVAILADGKPVATAKADETGAWAAVTERRFAPGEVELSLRAKSRDGRETAGQRVRVAIAAPSRPESTLDAVAAREMPIPITFVYNEATFTRDGRLAAARLAAFLIAQGTKTVSLTGHADERGTDPYNIELSRQRLATVATYLRERGYSGEFQLIPRGRAEPYAGVDRPSLSKEAAFQLDRRVEMQRAQ